MNTTVTENSKDGEYPPLPLISVVMITFNQERYVGMAIESILKQKTQFDYELIIGEDCSNDDTRNICIKYQKLFPSKIRLTPGGKNLGATQRFLTTASYAKAKYIAICEGDDYWTDPQKLQIQYDFLENNPSYSGIHTKVQYVDGDNQITGIEDIMPKSTDIVGFDYLVQQNVIRTCSFMFRADVLDEDVCRLLEASPMPDYTLFLATALKGEIYYLRNITAAYRNRFGITSSWKFFQTKKWHLSIYSSFEKQYNLKTYKRSLYATKQFNYFHVFAKGYDKGFAKARQLFFLIWYSMLTSMFPPDLRVNNVSGKDIAKEIYLKRPNIRNLFKGSKGK